MTQDRQAHSGPELVVSGINANGTNAEHCIGSREWKERKEKVFPRSRHVDKMKLEWGESHSKP